MQQRRVRLGDILDDYCPRERRITNHAVVAMVEDTVKQTRCTTCDADHEYKGARIPAARRRKAGALSSADVEALARPRAATASPDDSDPDLPEEMFEPAADADAGADADTPAPLPAGAAPLAPDAAPRAAAGETAVAAADGAADPDDAEPADEGDRDEWPVHRPLIRATLPRPEGQVPERKAPDFTFRPAGGRFESPRNGHRARGHRPMRQAQGQPSGQNRFGGPRSGPGQGSGQGPRHGAGQGSGQGSGGQGQRSGNRAGSPGGGRPAQGRGPRPAGGGGRKRGR